jgi:hypothetical protein
MQPQLQCPRALSSIFAGPGKGTGWLQPQDRPGCFRSQPGRRRSRKLTHRCSGIAGRMSAALKCFSSHCRAWKALFLFVPPLHENEKQPHLGRFSLDVSRFIDLKHVTTIDNHWHPIAAWVPGKSPDFPQKTGAEFKKRVKNFQAVYMVSRSPRSVCGGGCPIAFISFLEDTPVPVGLSIGSARRLSHRA